MVTISNGDIMQATRQVRPKIGNNITDFVGNTPLLRLNKISAGLHGDIVAKLEFFNPSSSVKDRPAFYMGDCAERAGALKPGMTLVEATSGNMGIGTALIGAARGYKVIIVMSDAMSVERRRLQSIYGAEIVLTPGELGTKGAVDKAEQLVRDNPNYVMLHQFCNDANPDGHSCSTAMEIWEDTDGEADILVVGIGTGGTFSGIARTLKELKPGFTAIAVEPDDHPLLSRGCAGPHNIQGLGAGFLPDVLFEDLIDEVITVKDADAGCMAQRLAREEGVLGGISSGANVWAAAQVALRPENEGKMIVTIVPDTGERYLSTWLYEDC